MIEAPLKKGHFWIGRECICWEYHYNGWYSCWSDAAGSYLHSDTLRSLKNIYKHYAETRGAITEKLK